MMSLQNQHKEKLKIVASFCLVKEQMSEIELIPLQIT